MPNIRITLMMLLSTICLSCERELSVADFRDEFGNYRPELKVEGLLQQDKPEDSIIRIIRTDTITNTDVYNGIDDDGGSVHDVIGTRCDPYTAKLLTGNDYHYCCQ